MRWFWAFPFTFVAGVHGFAIFAPYLVLIAMLAASRRSAGNSRRIVVSNPQSADARQPLVAMA
jgi:hypothetical protein